MKLCPQCEFIYEDDQRFCDMDGQELAHAPKARAYTDNTAALPPLPQSDHAANAVTKIYIPIPEPTPSPVAHTAAAGPLADHSSRWQPSGLAVAALAGLVLMALLFVVYYARSYQSQTRKANRSSSHSSSQSDSQSHAQPATQSADTQLETASASASATPLEMTASAPPLEQLPSGQASNEADSAGLTPLKSSSSLANGSDRSASRARQNSTLVATRTSADSGRAPVVIRLNNGASIKADEAWEKREGVWYRQAGMVTFLKRSRVRSIQRQNQPTRSQTDSKAEKSIAQNQPRVGTPAAVPAKKDSSVTSFLKKTGRILKKPFKS